MDVNEFVRDKVKWLGHASFRIEADAAVVYIDPWKLAQPRPADVICITHSHHDHLSPEDVERIRKPETVIVGPADCANEFGPAFRPIAPGQTQEIGSVVIEAVPAYNVDQNFHQKKEGWVGYLITVDTVRVYHSGDSDYIPEMGSISADVAFLPVGGTYTMTVEEAAQAAAAINPRVAVPMHCGDIVGTLDDREKFRQLSTVPVVILDPTD